MDIENSLVIEDLDPKYSVRSRISEEKADEMG
jgi:hypothetical protein